MTGELADRVDAGQEAKGFTSAARPTRKTPGMDGCLACDLADGKVPLPGGRIYETEGWVVEHCIGPLGAGTLIVKPKRHVTAVADLSEEEAAELGPLLHKASHVAATLVPAEQVYNCLWSHAGGQPGHIHYVVQPVTAAQIAAHDAFGPALQVAMFGDGKALGDAAVADLAAQAKRAFERWELD
jgi:diadenosine tetraphosphate (Ap4A) HIT family hydrolase